MSRAKQMRCLRLITNWEQGRGQLAKKNNEELTENIREQKTDPLKLHRLMGI